MSKKYVKMNPLIRVFDAIRDEKLDVIFDGYKWEEVTEAQWKRLKESQTKQGDVLIPTFIEKDEGMEGWKPDRYREGSNGGGFAEAYFRADLRMDVEQTDPRGPAFCRGVGP